MRIHAATGASIAALALLGATAVPAAGADVAAGGSTAVQSSPAAVRPTADAGPFGGLPRTLSTVRGERLGASQWGLSAVGAEGAWGITRGAGVTVAVLDSGVDDTHPDLAGRLLPTTDLVRDGRTGDPFGHGTRIAGIIAGVMDGAGMAGDGQRRPDPADPGPGRRR